MAYKSREWSNEGIYHITNRGNRRSDIFRDDDDFENFMDIVKKGVEFYTKDKINIIAYCLMDNHIHLLIKVNTISPGEFIGRITALYTRYFNKKNNYTGYLFGGRYHLEEVRNDSGLLEVSRYIHMNPVKAGMVKFPEDYKWSSYRTFIGEEDINFVQSDIVLRNFIFKYRFLLYKEYVQRDVLSNIVEEG